MSEVPPVWRPALFGGPMPVLETERLRLRPFTEADAADVEREAGNAEVARTLLTMPHPYPPGAALTWIAKHAEAWSSEKELPLAITWRADGAFIGVVALHFDLAHKHAEIGYWISRDEWGQGITSEAALAMTRWAFAEAGLHRVFARHMQMNPASGAVMQRIGMKFEGTLRQHYWRDDQPHDFHLYGVLKDEFAQFEAAKRREAQPFRRGPMRT